MTNLAINIRFISSRKGGVQKTAVEMTKKGDLLYKRK